MDGKCSGHRQGTYTRYADGILFAYQLCHITDRSLISSNQTIQDALIAADRLFQIMDLEREQDDSQKIELRKDMIGDIVFENVSFRYGSRKEVFNGLNLKIDKGKTTAVIGESGSGKTTLISLLQHIYPIQSGQIRIGEYDIFQISNKSFVVLLVLYHSKLSFLLVLL